MEDLRKVSELRSCLGRRWLTFGARCISLLMLKNLLTQKGNKKFVPELRSCKCFCVIYMRVMYISCMAMLHMNRMESNSGFSVSFSSFKSKVILQDWLHITKAREPNLLFSPKAQV